MDEKTVPFELHPNLVNKTFVIDLPLCRVLLEDESHYPWLLLIPRKPCLRHSMDLSPTDQLQLMHELQAAQEILWHEFNPTQINVAAIGNKTPQLHVHVIARRLEDPAWPGTVWDHPVRSPYSPGQKKLVVQQLFAKFKENKIQ
jgi:diadenosine tetraphosphate (Ap4A) HIT family hydrolase